LLPFPVFCPFSFRPDREASVSAVPGKPDLTGQAVVVEKETTVLRFAKDGSSVRLNEALPMPSQSDHVITLVKLKDGDVWLDATPEVAASGRC
jgi:hypothetical protein